MRLGFWNQTEIHLAELQAKGEAEEQLKDSRLSSGGCSKPSLQIGVGSRGLRLDAQGSCMDPQWWEEKAEAGETYFSPQSESCPEGASPCITAPHCGIHLESTLNASRIGPEGR